ncbi:MAG TPA: NADP-dependent phosphogluconate dehydrogenase [Polyangiaceae bacterium]
MEKMNFGIVGLGVMGENLAMNIESKGYSVVGFDLDSKKVDQFQTRTANRRAYAARSWADFVEHLEAPRRLLMMVPAGKAVDSVIAELRPQLAAGDILIDGGNTLYSDTDRRIRELSGTGLLYIGAGVSGGEEGALHGPAIMPGGNAEAWPLVKPLLQAIAAKAEDGAPCCEWVGSGGSGHFVKMVHNGIEYADMQMICEAYWLMQELLCMSKPAMSETFSAWNRSELGSYLIAITAEILAKNDPETGRPMVEVILDTAEQKGTGKWTSQIALDLGVASPTIADAVFARTLSAIKSERVAASRTLTGPRPTFSGNASEFIEKIRKALFASKICSYAQGFQLLRTANQQNHWDLQFGTIASGWRAGCIIRAQFLGRIKQAYARNAELANLLVDPYFAGIMSEYHDAWREVIAVAAVQGIPVPAFMSALAYYDGYRSERLPANLLQGQRDYFGAHTYQRVDKPGKFHTQWIE